MRIGLITGEYPPDQGGVGDFTRELGRALVTLGHEVHVLTGVSRDTEHETRTAKHENTKQESRNTVTVHRCVHGWGWRCWHDVLHLDDALRLDVLNVQYQAAAYQMHPAINLLPWWLRRRGRPPMVVTFHDLKVPYLFPKAGSLRRQVVLALARWADGIIVTNREDELQMAGYRLRAANLARIPIGSNITLRLPDGYDRDAWRARWGLKPGDLLLGYFGFLNERKGGEDLIEVLAALVARGLGAHLLLIGGRVGSSDPTNVAYAERVDRLIAERGMAARVHHTGFVPPEEVSASMAAVDVCVLPYRDGVSLRHGSLHACLAHGRPIVTTYPAVETPELHDGGNVLLVPAQDVGRLTDGVARLWQGPAVRQRLERGAARLAREFTWEQIAGSTVAFYERLTT
ncbi:MAG: glycosyltransferase family 4 protein [Chloroflexota bacterium]|nr:glycosyltransferase family 4 protein [Chloroflexota bacterium]